MNDLAAPGILRRVAALIALLASAVAVAVVIAGALHNAGALVLLLAGLLIAVGGLWHGLTRRRGRALAAGLALVGIGLLVAGFVVADWRTGRILLVVGLGLLAVVAARLALGRDRRTLRARVVARPRVAPAGRAVLLMNPRSGGGKVERFHLQEECRRRSIEAVVLRPGDDLRGLAESAARGGADVIGMAGGDGSQALVAGVALDHGLPMVVVPAGTRNHFALDLGLDRDDVVGALDAFRDGFEIAVDLATVNGRIFVNNATLGVYARIVQSPEYRDAKRQTALAMLPDLLGPDAPGAGFAFVGPDGVEQGETDVLLVANNPYQLTSIGGWGTRPRLDAGCLGITAVTVRDANEAAQFLALELAGQVRRFPGLLQWTGDRLEVTATAALDVGVDGEALLIEPPLVFESLPSALRVRLPRRAPGASPARRAVKLVSRNAVAELVSVLTDTGGQTSSLASRTEHLTCCPVRLA